MVVVPLLILELIKELIMQLSELRDAKNSYLMAV